jgi:hypothetical protein
MCSHISVHPKLGLKISHLGQLFSRIPNSLALCSTAISLSLNIASLRFNSASLPCAVLPVKPVASPPYPNPVAGTIWFRPPAVDDSVPSPRSVSWESKENAESLGCWKGFLGLSNGLASRSWDPDWLAGYVRYIRRGHKDHAHTYMSLYLMIAVSIAGRYFHRRVR